MERVLAVDYCVGAAAGVELDDVTGVRTEGRLVRDIGKGISSFDAFDTGAFLCTGGVFDALRDGVAAAETSLSAGMHRLADQGRLERCDVSGARWVDVDTRRDLRLASRWLLASGGKERDGAVAKVLGLLPFGCNRSTTRTPGWRSRCPAGRSHQSSARRQPGGRVRCSV
jgi:hypothetical protein